MQPIKDKAAIKLPLKVFIVINILPILIFIWLTVLGLDGLTNRQWGGAWLTLILAAVGVFIHYSISLGEQ